MRTRQRSLARPIAPPPIAPPPIAPHRVAAPHIAMDAARSGAPYDRRAGAHAVGLHGPGARDHDATPCALCVCPTYERWAAGRTRRCVTWRCSALSATASS